MSSSATACQGPFFPQRFASYRRSAVPQDAPGLTERQNKKPKLSFGLSEHRQSRCSAIESLLKQSFDCSPRALRCARARVSGGNPRITRPQPIFDGRSGTSISCKMAFSTKTLILRPEIDRGSNLRLPALGYRPAFAENDPLDHFPGASAPGDVHAVACGYNRRGCGPFDASQGLSTV